MKTKKYFVITLGILIIAWFLYLAMFHMEKQTAVDLILALPLGLGLGGIIIYLGIKIKMR